MTKFCYSTDGETYSSDDYSTREEAMRACIADNDLEPGDTYYTGEVNLFSPHIDVDRVLDHLREDADEQCGEWGETFLEAVKKEHKEILEERLNEVFEKWMEEFNEKPLCFTVTENQEHTVPEL